MFGFPIGPCGGLKIGEWGAALAKPGGGLSEVKPVAKPELGNKHHCQHCGTKFFDLNKNPVLCPKCGAVQQVASLRAVRVAAVPEKEEIVAEPGVELVSLDEVEAVEATLETVADDDVEIEDEPADTFLEEEEEDTDDVSGLIDGDIAPDEEP